MTVNPENLPEDAPEPDWDATVLQHARLDDLLSQFLDQSADAETKSPRAELTVQIQRIAWQQSTEAGDMADANTRPQQVGPYRIIDRLGSGGMGDVYIARHVVLNREVALKLLKQDRSLMPNAIERFHREMQALAALTHPNVVCAYDGDIQDELVYLAMELIDGMNLKQLLRQVGSLEQDICGELIRQAALGLSALHDAGIVHRDIKPSNIMLTRQGTVKILDLGLARLIDERSDLTGTLCAVGTERFMSPEQLLGLPDIDQRSDIYSLGRTLQHLLQWEESGDAEGAKSGIHGQLQTLVRNMTAQDRDQRLSSATTVAERLSELFGIPDPAAITAIAFTASATGCRPDMAVSAAASKAPTLFGPFGKAPRWLLPAVVILVVMAVVGLYSRERLPITESESDPLEAVKSPAEVLVEQTLPLRGAEHRATNTTSDATESDVSKDVAASERSIARWVLDNGGTTTVNFRTRDGWIGRQVSSPGGLPEGPFVVQMIDLSKENLSGPELQKICQLHSLQGLYLYDRSTSDELIFQLNPRWKLKWLNINGQVTDRGVAALSAYRDSLWVLDLSHSQVTNESVRLLQGFPLLRGLFLGNTGVSDEALPLLVNYPALVSLNISYTQVTGARIEMLTQCSLLTKLKCRNLPLNDEHLEQLSELPLVELDVRGTQMSAAAIQQYRSVHPECQVKY